MEDRERKEEARKEGEGKGNGGETGDHVQHGMACSIWAGNNRACINEHLSISCGF